MITDFQMYLFIFFLCSFSLFLWFLSSFGVFFVWHSHRQTTFLCIIHDTFEHKNTQLDVTGSNLTGACKLVFKVARNERNDNLFANIDVPGK